MTLHLVSVFARLGNDPWLEAGRLAKLPISEATESLARSISSMPTSIWPLQAATVIAARLIALLPTQSGESRRNPPASAYGAKAGPFLTIAVVLVCVACVVAFKAGVFTSSDAPAPDGSSVASFAVRPANDLVASRTYNRRRPQLDDRRGSRGPTGGKPRACPWRSQDVASARDVCPFPAMACQSYNATSHATPRAPPRHPFRRCTLPSGGLAGSRDVAISPDRTHSRRCRSRPTVPSERLSAGCRGP